MAVCLIELHNTALLEELLCNCSIRNTDFFIRVSYFFHGIVQITDPAVRSFVVFNSYSIVPDSNFDTS